MHPELTMPPDVQEFVTTFEQQHPGTWREAQSPNRDAADAWDARIRLMEDQTALQREMDSLAEQLALRARLLRSGARFLARFPKSKIEVALVLGLRSLSDLALGRGIRFKAAAYQLLPLLLLMEIFSGALFGSYSGVAHRAHVGGFLSGALAACLRYSGLEHKVNEAIEAKVTWTADPELVEAYKADGKGKLDQAIGTLKKYVVAKPNSTGAYALLQRICWRKSDIPWYRDAIVKPCQLHVQAQDFDAALEDYSGYRNSGRETLPASTWLELCRAAEAKEQFDRAVSEYQNPSAAYPTERQSLLALMAAGRLALKNLNRPTGALHYYKAAAASAVPQLDWEPNIEAGIREAEKTLGSYAPATRK